MEEKLNDLVARLNGAAANNLAAVIVHGSAVTMPANATKTDYQVLIVTHALTTRDLDAVRQVIQEWTAAGYSMPTFFTVKELNESLDVYPVEFSHMKRAYRVCFGEDPLKEREISKAHLRWQTEHELRGKLLRLRSLYLPASRSARDLTQLMTDSVVTFVRFLRSILDILGETPPLDRIATVRRLGERLGIDTTPLITVLELRESQKRLTDSEAQDLFRRFHDCLAQTVDCVNGI
jgi:hypothetical protein